MRTALLMILVCAAFFLGCRTQAARAQQENQPATSPVSSTQSQNPSESLSPPSPVTPTHPPTPAKEGEKTPATPAGVTNALPGIVIDRSAGYVDVEAVVIKPDGEWLEMIACVRGTKDHESLLNVHARPSHIHLALTMLGIKPGQPHKLNMIEEPLKPGEDPEDESRGRVIDGVRIRWEAIPATGPRVAVSIVREVDGKTVETPANEWVRNRKTGEVLEGNHWIFTGSRFIEHEGQEIYLADVNGSVISLVHFGDDLLARDTELTRDTDGGALDSNAEVIPPAGTEVKIRLRPLKEDKPQPHVDPQQPDLKQQKPAATGADTPAAEQDDE